MITIFNRKEVLSTYSMEAQSNARRLLQENGIRHIVNIHDIANGSRSGHSGCVAQNTNFERQYQIYVKNADYEQAQAILAGSFMR